VVVVAPPLDIFLAIDFVFFMGGANVGGDGQLQTGSGVLGGVGNGVLREGLGAGDHHGGRAGPGKFSGVLQTQGVPDIALGRAVRSRIRDLLRIAEPVDAWLVFQVPLIDVFVVTVSEKTL
jgi:hypothetical protein